MAYYLVVTPLQLEAADEIWVKTINRHHPVGTVLELTTSDIANTYTLGNFYIDKTWISQEFGWLTILS